MVCRFDVVRHANDASFTLPLASDQASMGLSKHRCDHCHLTDPTAKLTDIQQAVMLSMSCPVSASITDRRLHGAELHAYNLKMTHLNTTLSSPKVEIVSCQTVMR